MASSKHIASFMRRREIGDKTITQDIHKLLYSRTECVHSFRSAEGENEAVLDIFDIDFTPSG